MRQLKGLEWFHAFIIYTITYQIVIRVECVEYRTFDFAKPHDGNSRIVGGRGQVTTSNRRSDEFSPRAGTLDIRSRYWTRSEGHEEPEEAASSYHYSTIAAEDAEYPGSHSSDKNADGHHAYVTVDRNDKEHLVTINMPRMQMEGKQNHIFRKFVIQPVIQYVVQYDKNARREDQSTAATGNFEEFEGSQGQERLRRQHEGRVDRYFNDIDAKFESYWGNEDDSGGGGYSQHNEGFGGSDGRGQGYSTTNLRHQPPTVNAYVSSGGYGSEGNSGAGQDSNSNNAGMSLANAMQVSDQNKGQQQQASPMAAYGAPGMMMTSGQMGSGVAGQSDANTGGMGNGGMSQGTPMGMNQMNTGPTPTANTLYGVPGMTPGQPLSDQQMMMMPNLSGTMTMAQAMQSAQQQQQSLMMMQGGMSMTQNQLNAMGMMNSAAAAAATGGGSGIMNSGMGNQMGMGGGAANPMGMGTGGATQIGIGGAANQMGMGGSAANQMGMGGNAANQMGMGPGGAINPMGMGAGSATNPMGMGPGGTANSMGMGAGSAANQMGMGPGSAANQMGMGPGSAANQMGMGPGSAANQMGMGTGGATQMGMVGGTSHTGTAGGDANQMAMGGGGASQMAAISNIAGTMPLILSPSLSATAATSTPDLSAMLSMMGLGGDGNMQTLAQIMSGTSGSNAGPSPSYGPPGASNAETSQGNKLIVATTASMPAQAEEDDNSRPPMKKPGGRGKSRGRGRGGKSLLSSLPKLPSTIGGHLSFMFSTGFGKGRRGRNNGTNGGGGTGKPSEGGKVIDKEQVSDHILNFLGLTVHHPPNIPVNKSGTQPASTNHTNSVLLLWEQEGSSNATSLNTHLTSHLQGVTLEEAVGHLLPVPEALRAETKTPLSTTTAIPTTLDTTITTEAEPDPFSTTPFTESTTISSTIDTTESVTAVTTTELPVSTTSSEFLTTTATPKIASRKPKNVPFPSTTPAGEILLPDPVVFLTPPSLPDVIPATATVFDENQLKTYSNHNFSNPTSNHVVGLQKYSQPKPPERPNIAAYYAEANYMHNPVKLTQFDPWIYDALQSAFQPGQNAGNVYFQAMRKVGRNTGNRNFVAQILDIRPSQSREFHQELRLHSFPLGTTSGI